MGYTYGTRTVSSQIVTGGFCDRCGITIPVMKYVNNLVDASELEMLGWYGAFIDPLERTSLLLCKGCSQEAWDTFFAKTWGSRT